MITRTARPLKTLDVLMAAMGVVLVFLGCSYNFVELQPGGFVVFNHSVGPVGTIGLAVAVAAGSLIAIRRLFRVARSMESNECRAAVLLLVLNLVLFPGLWYGLALDGFHPWVFRQSTGFILSSWGTLLLACALANLTPLPARVLLAIERRPVTMLAGGIALGLATALILAGVVLEGLPHMSDATAYVLQARLLLSGLLAADPFPYPDLFEYSTFQNGPSGFYGKFPIGWPALLAPFVALGVGWAANPVLLAIVALLTYLIVRRFGEPTVAIVSGILVALSAWPIFFATDQHSHLASTLWLCVFYLGYDRAVFDSLGEAVAEGAPQAAWHWSTLAGLGLGSAILTRQLDALAFALPAIGFSVLLACRRPAFWIVRLSPVAVLASAGVALLLALNAFYTGDPLRSTYGRDFAGEISFIIHGSVDSPTDYPFWVHQSLADLNYFWFGGVFGVAAAIMLGVWKGGATIRRGWLFLLSSGSFLFGYAVPLVAAPLWFGPRWYGPLIPAIAFLSANALVWAWRTSRREGSTWKGLARGTLSVFSVCLVAVWTIVLPLRTWQLATRPPHGVRDRVLEAVADAGISNAVVGLPTFYRYPGTNQVTYKIARNALWVMKFPLDTNPVIFVAEVDGWVQKAAELWPDREIYKISEKPDDFSLRRVTGAVSPKN